MCLVFRATYNNPSWVQSVKIPKIRQIYIGEIGQDRNGDCKIEPPRWFRLFLPVCLSVCVVVQSLCAPVSVCLLINPLWTGIRLSVNPLCTAGKEVSQDEMDEMLESENTQIFTQNVRQLHLCSAILTLLSSPKQTPLASLSTLVYSSNHKHFVPSITSFSVFSTCHPFEVLQKRVFFNKCTY